MKAAIRWLGTLFVAFAVGTVISLAVIAGMLWWKGVLTDERLYGMLAALQGIKPPPPPSVTALDTRRRAAVVRSDSAIAPAGEPGPGPARKCDRQVAGRPADHRKIAAKREQAAGRLEGIVRRAARDAANGRHRHARSAKCSSRSRRSQPKQAKEQIMKMLGDPKSPADDPMEDIVRILKAMPLDKRKKILGEFKSPEEIEKLHEILRVVRLGGSDSELLRDTRSQLQQQGANP